MADPRVTIITPCYNADKYVSLTIKSVQAQTMESWEHIIVDDGSTDQSAIIIESFANSDSRVKLFRQSNAGMLTARVNAYPQSNPKSEYLLFLDADDTITLNMLEKLVAYLDENSSVGIVHCQFQFIDQNGVTVDDEDRRFDRSVAQGNGLKILPDTVRETPVEALCWWSPLTPSATLIRRSAYDEIGGWDEPLRYGCEDADLFMRIALKHPVHFYPENLASYRLHSQQMTKKHLFLQKEHLRFHKKWLQGTHLTQQEREWFRKTWFLYEGRIAPLYWMRHGFRKLLTGNVKGSLICFLRVWKHLAMVLTAPAREYLW